MVAPMTAARGFKHRVIVFPIFNQAATAELKGKTAWGPDIERDHVVIDMPAHRCRQGHVVLGDAIQRSAYIIQPWHFKHDVDATAGLGHFSQCQAVLAGVAVHEVDTRGELGRQRCVQDIGQAKP